MSRRPCSKDVLSRSSLALALLTYPQKLDLWARKVGIVLPRQQFSRERGVEFLRAVVEQVPLDIETRQLASAWLRGEDIKGNSMSFTHLSKETGVPVNVFQLIEKRRHLTRTANGRFTRESAIKWLRLMLTSNHLPITPKSHARLQAWVNANK